MELRLESRLSLADTLLGMLAASPAPGPGRYPLVNLVGPPGMGKSHTLRQLFARIAPQYAAAALDFAWHESTWEAAAPALAPLLPPGVPDHPDLAATPLRLTWAIPPAHAAGRPWLLLLDGVDGLERWPAIQQALIKPVAERSPALVVVATRAPVSWHFWELRGRCQAIPLPRLELDETLDIARHAARAPLGPSLHDLALGNPAAVEALLRHFRVAPPADLPPPRLEALGERARRAVEVIGLMRAVHAPTMRHVLARLVPGWDAALAADPRALDAVLRELKAHGHLLYSRRHSWIISPALRAAVAAELLARRPELLHAVCRELEERYFAAADACPLTDPAALNEWLYFSAALPPGDPLRDAWPRRLRHLLARRAALGGEEIGAQILRDEDLIGQLQRAGRLDAVYEALRERGPLAADLLTSDEDRYGEYVAELLDRMLSPASPEEGERLRALLDAAAELPDPFGAAELALVIARRSGDTVSGVRRDLALLVDRGCCAYDPARRTYALDPLLRRLIAPAPAVP
jgi:hypothetical protein